MLTTLIGAGVGAALLLGASWLTSYIGLRMLLGSGRLTSPASVDDASDQLAATFTAAARATAWTQAVGKVTGMLLVLGFIITCVKIIADLAGG